MRARLCLAACAALAVVAGGIDAEQHRRLDAPVAQLICRPEELAWCAEQPEDVSWPAVIFSAKETVYKVWYPLVGTWLDFHDARIDLDPAAGMFTAHIPPARVAEAARTIGEPPLLIKGRFALNDNLIRTAAVLPLTTDRP